jgi:hypothetical protein
VVGSLGAKRDSDGHLRHHGGATATDQTAVGKKHPTAATRCLNRRVHAGSARSDHQNVGCGMHRFLGHENLAADDDGLRIQA